MRFFTAKQEESLIKIMRFFIALEIPQSSQQQLIRVQHQLKQIIPNARLTDSDKFHVTLAFIGDQPDTIKTDLTDIMAKAVENISPFSLTPAFIDGFPNLHTAHILWVGVKGDIDKLFIIRERIKDGLLGLNQVVDERRYTPHIAIAKINGNFNLTPKQEEAIQEMMLEDFDPIQVDSIKLFESIPNHGFHSHNTLAEIKLK